MAEGHPSVIGARVPRGIPKESSNYPSNPGGRDWSIPDSDDHAKHLNLVRAASRFGFPFCVSGRP